MERLWHWTWTSGTVMDPSHRAHGLTGGGSAVAIVAHEGGALDCRLSVCSQGTRAAAIKLGV